PEVRLPSEPGMDIMDAGFRDNYGITMVARFMEVFQDWIRENTSGVVLIQVRSWEKTPEIKTADRNGVIRDLLNPLGVIGQQLRLQDFDQDAQIGFLADLFGPEMFDVVRFVYQPGENQDPASMSFHLTPRERENILAAWDLPHNQQALKKTLGLLGASE
ncbi:MAG TPA: patatin-like phospholipase family protein, partial [Saprospiraceae bacterium]|nr:patatin-like phospholipase family protein [Saprospiraceae bacterium]